MDTYPVTFAVDYPERSLNRLTTFFRIFTVIPIAIVITAITGFSTSYEDVGDTTVTVTTAGIGLLFLPPLLLILFRDLLQLWWWRDVRFWVCPLHLRDARKPLSEERHVVAVMRSAAR